MMETKDKMLLITIGVAILIWIVMIIFIEVFDLTVKTFGFWWVLVGCLLIQFGLNNMFGKMLMQQDATKCSKEKK